MSDFELSKVEVVEFVPKEASDEQWRQFHAYREIRHKELRPDDPFIPNEIIEDQLKRDDPFGKNHFFGVWHDGRWVSIFQVQEMFPENPGYETNKHLLWCGGGVLREFRRKGIGTMWVRKAVDMMEEWNKTVFSTGTEESEGHEFLKFLGIEEKMSAAENRLDFREIDWKMIESWVEEGKSKSPETKLEFYENRIPDEALEEFCPVFTSFLNTMPFEEMDHGDIVVTPLMMKEQYERMEMMGGHHHTFYTREQDGSITGITDVNWMPARAKYVEQQFTGVDPDARGRGLGKWLKASMLLYLRDKYADLEWVVTGNANSNAPMLAINKQIGFKEFKAQSAYQIEIGPLKAFLAKTDKGKVAVA